MRRERSNAGITLTEVLIVILIVSILAGILFSSLATSKKSARVTREEVQIRNLYVAVNLYEADNGDRSPLSLSEVVPVYAPGTALTNPDDARHSLKLPDWPANPWILWSEQDDSVISRMRSKDMVSYFYLASWQRAFPKGRSYEELRNDPEVGFIAGLGLFECTAGLRGESSNCNYDGLRSPYNQGHPAVNLGGIMVQSRTDGSIVTRRRNGPCQNGMRFSQVFLFQDMTCLDTSQGAKER